jgi:hypothetical protein
MASVAHHNRSILCWPMAHARVLTDGRIGGQRALLSLRAYAKLVRSLEMPVLQMCRDNACVGIL